MATSSSHQDNPQKVQFPLDSAAYKDLQEIGSGDNVVVYKAVCVPMNSAIIAIKSVDLNQATADFEVKLRDTKTLSLSHPNILSDHCSFTTADRRLWVVMPFMAFGSLISSSAFPEGLPEPCLALVLEETLNAMSYLHGQEHVHGDIKPGNILVDSDGSVKLADFGVSASFYGADHSTGANDTSATPYWVAPNGGGCKADIWAFGITALELALGGPPVSDLPPFLESQILKVKNRFPFSDYKNIIKDFKNKKYSADFKDLVGSCLDRDPEKRPAAETLLKHSFFHNYSGKDFLVGTVLPHLESVEERFKKRNSGLGELLGKEKCGELRAENMGFSGWNFNEDDFVFNPVFATGGGKSLLSMFATRLTTQLQILVIIIRLLTEVVEVSTQDQVEIQRLKGELVNKKEDILQFQDNLERFVLDLAIPAASSSTSSFPAESSNRGNARLVELREIARKLDEQMENVKSIIGQLGQTGEVQILKTELESEYDICVNFQVELEVIMQRLYTDESD
ncbi:serine/threonine-protein kinase BLUS1-like [Pyrus ussuriensis x Pyrus communis]|uniref:Serine/threonine-protein kinase BLUS1-like n=1 Tax=Pyrus ussuriensis x Pyrus communis TaxID=2448454 RepID=A0A5N5H6T8_9ROSA|nr:serine/threonine-protein kinase BLUS1-like [Pyrus ussuriensis x Pyrus communis]